MAISNTDVNILINFIRKIEYGVNQPMTMDFLYRLVNDDPQRAIEIVKELELENGDSEDSNIYRDVKSGHNKIECIKRCRKRTGKGLKESKEYVEDFLARYSIDIPILK